MIKGIKRYKAPSNRTNFLPIIGITLLLSAESIYFKTDNSTAAANQQIPIKAIKAATAPLNNAMRNPFRNNKQISPLESNLQQQTNTPILRGIIQHKDRTLAIIESENQSNVYAAGQNIGKYRISRLNADGVTLTAPDKTLQLKLERH